MKLILANTDAKVTKLMKRLDDLGDEHIGFDTEVSGPLLRGRDFTNITHSVLLGLSVAFEDEECYYLPVRHKGNNISFEHLHQVCSVLQTHARQRRVWAHNAKFDHQVMIREGYPMVGMLDSMVAAWLATGKNKGIGLKELASRLLGRQSPAYDPSIAFKTGAEVLEYACHDALNTLQIGLSYCPREYDDRTDTLWFFQECDFTYVLAKMKLQGIALDVDGLREIRERGENLLADKKDRWDKLAPFLSITSTKDLQTLFEEGIWREHGRTSTGAFQTGKESMQYQLEHGRGDGPILAQLRLDHQAINKLVSTYTTGLIEEAEQWADGKLHPDLHHFGTVTGRLSSTYPNIQNQPSHGMWAERVKACFVPDPGMEFTSADYSQVELRYFANYCGGALLQAFVDGKDLHVETGDAMGVGRDAGKTVNFGFLLYGGGARKLAGLLDVPEAEAARLLTRLQARYPEVEVWRNRVVETVRMRSPRPWCKTLAGRIRYIPELNPEQWRLDDPEAYEITVAALRKKYNITNDRRIQSAIFSRGKRLVVNYLVQGGSRDLLVIGMNGYQKHVDRFPQECHNFSVVTTVHDEVLTQHPIGYGSEARKLLQRSLEGAGTYLGLRVPIVAEPATGMTWGAVH